MDDLLDNPLHHGLATVHASLAIRHGRAARYPFDLAPMASLDDPADPAAWADLITLLGPGGRVALFTAEPTDLPAGITALRRQAIEQMIAPETLPPLGPAPAGLTPLSIDDATDVLDLAKRTEPGPMMPRTVTMGRYLGIRSPEGALLAMAGERMATPHHVEISGVCTDPAARGRGYAADLVTRLATASAARGQRAFLHVKTDNESARRVYLRLGFTVRHIMHLTVIQVA